MYFKEFPAILYDFEVTTTLGVGEQAVAYSNLSADGVGSVTITNPGSGYTSASITFSDPENTGVTATAYAVINNGSITKIIMKNAGGGYIMPPTVIITPPYGNLKKETRAYALTDISRNIRFRKELLSNVTAYEYYDIVDGETPEIIAEKIYGNPEYHWVVMLTNGLYDYRKDFPLTLLQLEKYVVDKYKVDRQRHNFYRMETLPYASNSSITISNLAIKMLKEVFEEGEIYKKAGVIVTNIIPESQKQFHLFEEENPKHLKLMQVMDDYYKKTGERKIKLANQDLTRTWTMKQEHLSKKYTTDIREILTIKCP